MNEYNSTLKNNDIPKSFLLPRIGERNRFMELFHTFQINNHQHIVLTESNNALHIKASSTVSQERRAEAIMQVLLHMNSSISGRVRWSVGFLELHESNTSPVQELRVQKWVSVQAVRPREKTLTKAVRFACFVLPVQGRNCEPLVIKPGECYE